MQIEYVLKDGMGRYVHRDITGKFGITSSEALADHYDSRKSAKNVLDNCLNASMRRSFFVEEIVVSGGLPTSGQGKPEPQKVRPKVEEALRIANQPIIENKIGEFADAFDKVKDIMLQAVRRKEELLTDLSRVDSEISDINHYIELADDLNAYQGYLAYRMLRQRLRQRRQIKDEIGVIKAICESDIGRADFEKIERCIGSLEGRRYEPRVLSELFS